MAVRSVSALAGRSCPAVRAFSSNDPQACQAPKHRVETGQAAQARRLASVEGSVVEGIPQKS